MPAFHCTHGICITTTRYVEYSSGLLRPRAVLARGGIDVAAIGQMPVKWDEANLEANAEEATAANRMQITEPKTPFHYLGDDGEPEAYPPKAAPATAAPREAKQAASQQVQPGMDLSKLASASLERREEQPDPEDEPEGATAHRIAGPPRPQTLTGHVHAQTKGASSTSRGRCTTRREAWQRCGRKRWRLWLRRRRRMTTRKTILGMEIRRESRLGMGLVRVLVVPRVVSPGGSV